MRRCADVMNSFGLTDKGKVRSKNEDCFAVERVDEKDCLIAAVCDGMGGEKAGETASAIAVRSFVSYTAAELRQETKKNPDVAAVLERACAEANNIVYAYSCFDRDYEGMGTTLVAAVLIGGRTYVVNVGDSRAYMLSGSHLTQISHDHSVVQEMVDRGEITALGARVHPRRNEITRAVGAEESVRCDVFTPKLKKGDRLILCSDGLTNMLMDEEIVLIARKNRDLYDLGRALMKAALDKGARDNVTVVVVSK